jgi:hypothetical protein
MRRIDALRGSVSTPRKPEVETVTGKLFDVSLVEPERGIQVRARSSGEHR